MIETGMIAQRSQDWFAARLGKVTASRVADVVAETRTGWAASRASYQSQLLAERLTRIVAASPPSAAMQWGIDHEPHACNAYMFRRDVEVTPIGFIDHPTIPMTGASPDGLVGADGLVEIKCPTTASHLATLLEHTIPQRYQLQMLWQMACTGRSWCDYVSFDPRLPEGACLMVIRLDRDADRIARLEQEVAAFLDELDVVADLLRRQYQLQSIGVDQWRQLGPPALPTALAWPI